MSTNEYSSEAGSATSRIPDMASRVLRQVQHPDAALNELAYEIKAAIRAVDPSVNGVGCVYGMNNEGFNRLDAILISRPDAPVFVKAPDRVFDEKTPDYELLRLGALFQSALAVQEEAKARAEDGGSWDAWLKAYETSNSLLQEIAKLPATTVAGLRLKAICIKWCHHGEDVIELSEQQTTDIRLAQQIIEGLLNFGGRSA